MFRLFLDVESGPHLEKFRTKKQDSGVYVSRILTQPLRELLFSITESLPGGQGHTHFRRQSIPIK